MTQFCDPLKFFTLSVCPPVLNPGPGVCWSSPLFQPHGVQGPTRWGLQPGGLNLEVGEPSGHGRVSLPGAVFPVPILAEISFSAGW